MVQLILLPTTTKSILICVFTGLKRIWQRIGHSLRPMVACILVKSALLRIRSLPVWVCRLSAMNPDIHPVFIQLLHLQIVSDKREKTCWPGLNSWVSLHPKARSCSTWPAPTSRIVSDSNHKADFVYAYIVLHKEYQRSRDSTALLLYYSSSFLEIINSTELSSNELNSSRW